MQQSSSSGFQESNAKSVREGAQELLTNISRNNCVSRTQLTSSNVHQRGLVKATGTERKTEESYSLTKLRYRRLIHFQKKLTSEAGSQQSFHVDQAKQEGKQRHY